MALNLIKIICLMAITIMAMCIANLANTITNTINYNVPTIVNNVNKSLADIQSIEANTTRTEAEMAGLLNTTRHIAIDERMATKTQIDQVSKIGDQISDLVTHAEITVDDTTEVENHLIGLIDQSRVSITDMTKRSDQLIDNATVAIDATDIRTTMVNIAASSADVKRATGDAAASMADVRTGIHYELTELMKPVKKIKVISEEAVRLIGKFLGY